MHPVRRAVLAGIVLCLVTANAGLLAARQPAAAAPKPAPAATLTPAEIETFLKRAKIVRKRGVSKGVTGTMRATLSDGTITHDASIQTIDEAKKQFQGSQGTELNFRDTWRFNVAAYQLGQLLALDMIPVSVERRFEGKEASFTWWIDDVIMDEGERLKKQMSPPDAASWNEQMWIVRVFDQLIYNTDRNLGNLLITGEWRVWMIDHSRAFRFNKDLRSPENMTKCDRQLLEKMRALDKPTLEKALGKYLGPVEIAGLLARRDLIVAHFDKAGDPGLYDARLR